MYARVEPGTRLMKRWGGAAASGPDVRVGRRRGEGHGGDGGADGAVHRAAGQAAARAAVQPAGRHGGERRRLHHPSVRLSSSFLALISSRTLEVNPISCRKATPLFPTPHSLSGSDSPSRALATCFAWRAASRTLRSHHIAAPPAMTYQTRRFLREALGSAPCWGAGRCTDCRSRGKPHSLTV